MNKFLNFADIVQFERFYNRRNRYILIANFGPETSSLEEVADVYSMGELLMDTSGTIGPGVAPEDPGVESLGEIKIGEHSLPGGHALVIKLPR